MDLLEAIGSLDQLLQRREAGRSNLTSLFVMFPGEQRVVPQFELNETPKAFANFSPGLELATTLGIRSDIQAKP